MSRLRSTLTFFSLWVVLSNLSMVFATELNEEKDDSSQVTVELVPPVFRILNSTSDDLVLKLDSYDPYYPGAPQRICLKYVLAEADKTLIVTPFELDEVYSRVSVLSLLTPLENDPLYKSETKSSGDKQKKDRLLSQIHFVEKDRVDWKNKWGAVGTKGEEFRIHILQISNGMYIISGDAEKYEGSGCCVM